MPEDFKAELIGGIVYVASPLRRKHATLHPWLSAVLFAYQCATPGVELGDNGTVLLDDQSEPQPDLFLRILPASGGLSRTTPDDFVEGPPELVLEIAHSSRAIDLHAKREDYTRCGIPEYLVYLAGEQRLVWFNLAQGVELQPGSDRVFKLQQFPGLWIHERALVEKDSTKLFAVLNEGVATPEHRNFVEKLKASQQK